jgi:hypothetical protein
VAIAKMVRTEIAESMANGTCHRVICLCIQKDACQVVPALAYGRIFPWYWCFVYRRVDNEPVVWVIHDKGIMR